jgi:uncharacterized protein (TIGR03083 family)
VADAFDISGAREAMLRQFEATNALVARLSEDEANRPTRLEPWRVIELVTHISGSLDFVLLALRTHVEDGTGMSALHWYGGVEESAAFIDEEVRAEAAAGWIEIRDAMASRLAEVTGLLAGEDLDRVVLAMGFAPMTVETVCATRCVEVVLHTLDLIDATSMACDLDAGAVDLVRRFVRVADNGALIARPEL